MVFIALVSIDFPILVVVPRAAHEARINAFVHRIRFLISGIFNFCRPVNYTQHLCMSHDGVTKVRISPVFIEIEVVFLMIHESYNFHKSTVTFLKMGTQRIATRRTGMFLYTLLALVYIEIELP